MNISLVSQEAYGVVEISKTILSSATEKELIPEGFEFQEQKTAPIGLLLRITVIQHHSVPVKRKKNDFYENSFD